MTPQHKKLAFALLGVFLMTSGIFVLISYVPQSSSNSGYGGTAIPALNSVGETGSTSIGVNYWVQSSVANSGTTTLDMNIGENSGYSTVSLGDTSATWSYAKYLTTSEYKLTYINIAIPTAQFWTNSNTNTVGLQTLAFMSQLASSNTASTYAVGTIYANLTLNGAGMNPTTYSWSTTSLASDSSSDARVVYIYPQWDIYSGTPVFDTYGTANLNISLTPYVSSVGTTYYWVGSSTNGYVTSTVESGTTYTTQTSLPAQAAVNYEMGYYIESATTSFTIPQYESAFNLTWSSEYETNPQYNVQFHS